MNRAGIAQMSAAPLGTLRLQLHAGYTLDDARADLPYFARLGVSHLYLSPISQSRAGSTHGYDVVDHAAIDQERGGEPAFRRLAQEARRAGMGILLDIVPNHMATDPTNGWWWDVLTRGRSSPWARWFDIDWQAPALPGKVLLPFLERPYARALYAGDISLRYDAKLGLHVAVHDQPYPLAPESLASLGLEATTGKETSPRRGCRRYCEHIMPRIVRAGGACISCCSVSTTVWRGGVGRLTPSIGAASLRSAS